MLKERDFIYIIKPIDGVSILQNDIQTPAYTLALKLVVWLSFPSNSIISVWFDVETRNAVISEINRGKISLNANC